MDALIFIDTNIFLDFYRIRSGGVGLSLLEHIDNSHVRLITSNQIEMEYKKNRQRVILESLGRLKTPDWGSLTPPAFLARAKPAIQIEKEKTRLTTQQKKLKDRIEAILSDPAKTDPVYQVLQRLFRNGSEYNLGREKKIRYEIRRLARKRYMLGYPPRKDGEISMGDAINWEWIIYCAEKSKKDIVIVSRDRDYGIDYDDEHILNDWLAQEFKERVSRKRKILLTARLAHAFKLASVAVTKEEEKEEEELIKSTTDVAQPEFQSELVNRASTIEAWIKIIKQLEDGIEKYKKRQLQINSKE